MRLLAYTLSICLLGLLPGCVFICADHIEDSIADSHCLSKSCADEDCPVTASAASTLPERSFRSTLLDDNLSQQSPEFHVQIISNRSMRRLPFASSLDPPLERLAVLRI
jgi:hypothetical protein